ncbi:PQQ-dependent sugar dehydrogenase [Luteimonas sp. XNQY3]|nr:PQQ-dependent sugar dehydrogenase [Luteimonas sp. XNQY3]MCD9007415.1 PQQ-dependent sugar dehydrogenase [Luteimonas sp. XNQY3]
MSIAFPRLPVPHATRRPIARIGIACVALLSMLLASAAMAGARGYRVETVAGGLDHPWSLAFLPDGRMLVTERAGRLRVVERGTDGAFALRDAPVDGVPQVLAMGQAGLFDVMVDPDFAQTGIVYLSFAHGTADANHLRIVRARFDGARLHDIAPVFTSQPAKRAGQHFGGRMALLADGTLATAVGDGNLERTDAQRLHTHLGKTIRVHTDGRVPRDNPFVGRDGALPEIYSTGHRNPQAMVRVGNVLYSNEHGARGGDELNVIASGANYGWPITTDGVDYTGARVTPYRTWPGITAPLIHWTPSIAPSGMAWYDASLFPAWRGSLFVSALAERSVRRVPMAGATPGTQEILFTELGERIRDVRAGPDGALYLLTDSASGRVLRIVPAD